MFHHVDCKHSNDRKGRKITHTNLRTHLDVEKMRRGESPLSRETLGLRISLWKVFSSYDSPQCLDLNGENLSKKI